MSKLSSEEKVLKLIKDTIVLNQQIKALDRRKEAIDKTKDDILNEMRDLRNSIEQNKNIITQLLEGQEVELKETGEINEKR